MPDFDPGAAIQAAIDADLQHELDTRMQQAIDQELHEDRMLSYDDDGYMDEEWGFCSVHEELILPSDDYDGFPCDEFGLYPEDYDEMEDYRLERELEAQSALEEKLYARNVVGMRRARIIKEPETGLTRTRDRHPFNPENSWERKRKTRWLRAKSNCVLPAELGI